MKHRKKVEWSRLDNASKIFPATCNEKDTKVFRLVCELYEAVDSEKLQLALNRTIESFPLYKSVLRKGVFWYYFEASEILPLVKIESYPVCAPIYIDDKKNLLFRVFYFNNRISLEVFHALADGTGALRFLQALVYEYLMIRYNETFTDKIPKLNYIASASEKSDDSFIRHFEGNDILTQIFTNKNRTDSSRAYQIRGTRTDENRMSVIEGCMSVKAILLEAHKYNTTLTVFVTSLFIYSIYKEMSIRGKKLPVILSIPINLRNYFESETARNFFSSKKVAYLFAKGNNDLKDVIQHVSEVFRVELAEELLSKQVNQLMSLEKNPFARIIPLPLKNFLLRIAHKVTDSRTTAAVSNIGQVSMPLEFESYIRQFSLSLSARRPQICICSYRDRLVVSFSSPFRETEIQKLFFGFLSNKGIEIEISSNL